MLPLIKYVQKYHLCSLCWRKNLGFNLRCDSMAMTKTIRQVFLCLYFLWNILSLFVLHRGTKVQIFIGIPTLDPDQCSNMDITHKLLVLYRCHITRSKWFAINTDSTWIQISSKHGSHNQRKDVYETSCVSRTWPKRQMLVLGEIQCLSGSGACIGYMLISRIIALAVVLGYIF